MTLKIKIYGKVQGVNFRRETRLNALKNNIKGYVKNGSDGNVIIEAQGKENDLKKFIVWCRIGSLNAKISNIDIVSIKNDTIFNSFEIR